MVLPRGKRPPTDRSSPTRPDWPALTEKYIHPAKVFVFEAVEWIGEPLSPRELDKLSDGVFGLVGLAYHLRELDRVGLMAMIDVAEVRGAREHFYFLPSD
jgi:hypothetical protein